MGRRDRRFDDRRKSVKSSLQREGKQTNSGTALLMTHLRMADLELAAEAKIQVPVGQGRQMMKAA